MICSKKEFSLFAFLSLFLPMQGSADIKIILIDESELPFSLSPNRFTNSPNRFTNSPTRFSNSESRFTNSPTRFSNTPNKFSNGPSGTNRLLADGDRYVGYYVPTDDDITNFFSSDGERIAFNPSLEETQSLFHSSETEWCGTFLSEDGKRVLGLVASCYYRFLD